MREIAFELSEVSYPDSTTRSFYLNELMEYERYTVMVRVSTSAGYSEYTAARHVRTTEAGMTITTKQDYRLSLTIVTQHGINDKQ